MQEYILKVTPQDSGRRLDTFLMQFSNQRHLGFSRTFIQKMILNERIVKENLEDGDGKIKKTKLKSHYKIKTDDVFKIYVQDTMQDIIKPQDIPLDIVYEDQDLAIINKPCGMVVHPAPGNYEHTLVNALLKHFKELSDVNPKKPGIVHRLDKETSGLLVIAKNNFTHLALTKQFSRHNIKRKYIALVKGKMEFDEEIIELPIGRHPYKRKNMWVSFDKKTKYAKTYYHTLKRTKEFSILELEPYTGRTHQLRVHLAFLEHPILGDTRYGKNNEFSRLALHAKSIGFIHPRTAKFVEFFCEVPKEFSEFIS